MNSNLLDPSLEGRLDYVVVAQENSILGSLFSRYWINGYRILG